MTNLTGTKWLINENPNCSSSSVKQYSINFYWSDDKTRTFTNFSVGGNSIIQFLAPTLFIAYKQGTWYNTTTRTIEILGGTDATNSNLINWMQANAVQVRSSYGITNAVTHATLTPLMAAAGKDYIGTISPDLGYKSPETVLINGTSYNVINNQFTVPNIAADMTVSGTAIENPVSDLTGTTWRFNNDGGIIRTVEKYQTFNVTGVIKGDYNGTEVVVESTSSNNIVALYEKERYFSGFLSNTYAADKFFCYGPNEFVNQWVYRPGSNTNFESVSNVRITFTGGTGVTNSTLIRWIQANATPVIVTYNVTYSIQNAICTPETIQSGGTLTFQITPNKGYLYPSNVVVNGTYNKVTYNSLTGVGIVTGVLSDISISGKAIAEFVTVDFTTLSGWNNITAGQHSLTIVAMGNNYADSVPSAAITINKIIKYNVTIEATHITYTPNPLPSVGAGESLEITLTADNGYTMPTTAPTVTNATVTYNRVSDSQCRLTLTNITGNITFTLTAIKRLDTPTNVTVSDAYVVEFDKVENATNYDVLVDGTVIGNYKAAVTKTFTLPQPSGVGTPAEEWKMDGYTAVQGDIQVSEDVYNAMTVLNAGGSLTDWGNTCGLTIGTNYQKLNPMGIRVEVDPDAPYDPIITEDGKYQITITMVDLISSMDNSLKFIEYNFTNNTATMTAIPAEDIDIENHVITFPAAHADGTTLYMFIYEAATPLNGYKVTFASNFSYGNGSGYSPSPSISSDTGYSVDLSASSTLALYGKM